MDTRHIDEEITAWGFEPLGQQRLELLREIAAIYEGAGVVVDDQAR